MSSFHAPEHFPVFGVSIRTTGFASPILETDGVVSPARFSPQMSFPAVLKPISFSAVFLVPVLFSAGTLHAEGAAETPWQRIVVIGASASAGFNTGREAGRTANVARVIEACESRNS